MFFNVFLKTGPRPPLPGKKVQKTVLCSKGAFFNIIIALKVYYVSDTGAIVSANATTVITYVPAPPPLSSAHYWFLADFSS